jgi:outer membrane lipoprotein-sorting protein
MVIAALVAALSLSSPQDNAWTSLTARLKAAKSIQGKLDLTGTGDTGTASFRMMRPKYVQFNMPGMEVWFDGKSTWMYHPEMKQYSEIPSSVAGMLHEVPFLVGLEAFWPSGKVPVPKAVEEKEVDGVRYAKVTLPLVHDMMKGYTAELLIDPGTGLPARFEMFREGKPQGGGIYKELVIDPPLTETDFKFVPPAGSKVAETPAPQDYTKNLLKKGAKAPDFSLKTPAGGAVNLAAKLKTKKAVLINFWFYG